MLPLVVGRLGQDEKAPLLQKHAVRHCRPDMTELHDAGRAEIEYCNFEQNDEWAVQRARYMTLETIAPLGDDPAIMLPAVTA